jgi:hypothetical protein
MLLRYFLVSQLGGRERLGVGLERVYGWVYATMEVNPQSERRSA